MVPYKHLYKTGGFAKQIFEHAKLKITDRWTRSCEGFGQDPEEDKQFDVKMMTLCVV